MEEPRDAISVLIRPQTGRRFTLVVKASDTIDSVKAKIHDKADIHPDQQLLVHRGQPMEDGRTLSDYNVTGMWPIYLHWDEETAELDG